MAKRNDILFRRLKDHFGTDPGDLLVLGQMYATYERPSLHLAIEELTAAADPGATLKGIVVWEEDGGANLSKLSRPATASYFDEGPVEYIDEPLPNGQRLSCVKRGLFLFRERGQPLAVVITDLRFGHPGDILVEVMGLTKEHTEVSSRRLSMLVRQGKAFRGHVLSLEFDCYHNLKLQFHQLPAVNRSQIILPEELLRRIERHTLAFSEQAARLAAAGRHLKRGILLHGPPGTGKTFSAMYLAARMPGRTVFLLTGEGMGSIETACQLARLMAPATVILEDVNLIGTERSGQTVGANALLFELLNQMDGLADDADILFILTTNRPEILEPALASRPGRIDQAIEVPLPDANCRRRLLDLYGQGLTIEVERLDDFVNRLEGVSAAFIRELLRKAAVYAALESEGALIIKDRHLEEGIAELLVAGGPLTQSLLGSKATAKG